jgi:hypothetical protein
MLPMMIVVIDWAEPDTTEPTTPMMLAMTMNHFLPNRSLKEPLSLSALDLQR